MQAQRKSDFSDRSGHLPRKHRRITLDRRPGRNQVTIDHGVLYRHPCVGTLLERGQAPKPRDKDLGVYTYDFPEGGDISGTVMLEYFANGLPSLKDDADFGKLYTPEGDLVVIELEMPGGAKPVFELTFALEGDIDQEADTATVSGDGTLTSGEFGGEFSFYNLVLTELSSYPDGGTFEYVSGAITLVVEYDGDSTASVSVDGVIKYEIDLDTGLVTLIEE